VAVAGVRSGISGWVIALLIRGRAGAERSGELRKARRLLINRPGSSLYEESDPKERLRVSNWIVRRLLSDCEGKVLGLPIAK
jgi:hypothetical protein